MNKKLVIGIVIILCIIGIPLFSVLNSKNMNNQGPKELGKVLVVYFSAQGHTKTVAEKIARNLNADIFEIIPKQNYTSEDLDWTNDNSRVSKEHNDESLRNIDLINTKVEKWDSYDTILIGYPIWWGIAAWPVNNFIKDNDFNGKTIIPFCTSASSDIGDSGKNLEKLAGSGNWLEGYRFNSNPSDNDIKQFTDSLS
ncbi:MAG: flavodoxin [Bacilli bacterium]